MELLDKEISDAQTRIEELRGATAALLAQEDQLRLQNASIRDHLASGCKGEVDIASEAQAPTGVVNPP